ncbi:VacJ family lipoprotein [Methylobacter sp. Wu8]|jgi:phospholipid-binding lipoprotein MlaA|uniref:Phospholipid-binding lipoprotein MlaA n=1 Tax=Methylobacter tundripaludum TaxID=173365 RepID=A0A2S6H6Q0_9GAMM|nr:VacJ family lipoprotein [Methylobacter tundripaludum]MCF7964632.1 VacJ family lipoprotein [Methylobacter tundripaludum]MCK9635040.1 VacJ family lipoprotein [Methylobacter tundripaludum]PPK73162.1 phospholipid-binding lipoprotein MlaA [Methylobacter tundripaludum]
MRQKKLITQLGCLVLLGALGGCATSAKDPQDPFEEWNRGVQTFNDNLDEYAMKPVAKGYQWITPSFVDRGVTNFFSNINDIGVTINDLLQFKIEQTGMDGSRFLVNTVAGLAGFIDVAEMIDLPKHNEDFDQTMGVWGVPAGPYLVLPFFGPSSPRGVGGLIGDAAMNPISYIDSGAITGGLFALNAADLRADNLATEKIATEAAVDRYAFFKSAYFQHREYLIHDGNLPEGHDLLELDKEFNEDNLGPIKPY